MSHSYKTLYNNPTERQKVFYPWCYWDNAFNEDELKFTHSINDAENEQQINRSSRP